MNTNGDGFALVPPQNLEAEESVLGAMMLSPGVIGTVSEIITGIDFYRPSHAKIFDAAIALYVKGEPVDAITMAVELDERGQLDVIGGKARVHELAALVPATANAAHYAGIVRDSAVLRGLIRVGNEIAELALTGEGDADSLVNEAEQRLFELSQGKKSSDYSHIKDLVEEAYTKITFLHESGEDLIGVPSGFRQLDNITCGFQPGNLIVIASRPSMGKSALALNIAANVTIREKIPVALFTLEMSESEVTQRMIGSEGNIDSQKVRTGKLNEDDWSRMGKASQSLSDSPLLVVDSALITPLEIRAKTRRMKQKQSDLGLVIVDYLQLMTVGKQMENRVQEVSQITRQLKVLARDLDLPVIALSQLSRAVEQRGDKRPILSDLRESGGIEQDADIVIFIYRDDYYDENSDSAGVAEFHIAKHRNGPTDTVKLSFIKRYAKFSDDRFAT